MILNMTFRPVAVWDSLTNAVALEALVDVADDLELVVHGEV